VVPLWLIKNLKIDVGRVKKIMTFIVLDLLLVDNDYKKMLGNTWLKHIQLKHDLGTNKIKMERKKVVVSVQRTMVLHVSKRVLAWEDYNW
jgi:hypothetical protein